MVQAKYVWVAINLRTMTVTRPNRWNCRRGFIGGLFQEVLARRFSTSGWDQLVSNSAIRAITHNEQFDSIHLLSGFSAELTHTFTRWLNKPLTPHLVEVSAWDYSSVFEIAYPFLLQIQRDHQGENPELCLNLSSGTHPMMAVLLLLGCTHYPATLYQTIAGKSSQAVVPFNLDLMLHERFAKADQVWAGIPFRSPAEVPGFEDIIGASPGLCKAVERARRAAIRNVSVLLLGESGVGKELFARAIHKASGRKKGPFVAVNCAAIPRDLLESELFGHVKGAFTGAYADKPGSFKDADGGTLFLDEIGEMEVGLQAKLLRVVESSARGKSSTDLEIPRVGKLAEPVSVNVRIVAATNRDLLDRKAEHPFRLDLYYRLCTIPIEIPPLRSRGADLPLLAEKLVEDINKEFSNDNTEPAYQPKKLSSAAVRRLKHYEWPGNVRELKAILTRALVLYKNPELTRADMDREILSIRTEAADNVFSRMRGSEFKLKDRLRLIEKTLIEDALAACRT